MKLSKKHLLVIYFLSFLSINAWGFQLSPCYRVLTYDDHMPAQEPIRYIGYGCAVILSKQELTAVHEHLTIAAIRKYRSNFISSALTEPWKLEYMMEPEWSMSERHHRSFAIIFGTWWNDDPLMQSLGQGFGFIRGGKVIWSALQSEQPSYTAGRRGCYVSTEDHLGRQSHLGNLQHLHFMTSIDGRDPALRAQRVDLTIEKALSWIAFAYQVATGELSSEQALTTEIELKLGLPSIAENHCVRRDNVKVRTLFARRGQTIVERNKRTPDIALGSMLHVLQDSFSPSHTCRVAKVIEGKQRAVLFDVKNYRGQDKHEHSSLDGYPTWFRDFLTHGEHHYENDPVTVGAWLIAAVDNRMPWANVEAHLRNTIFSRVGPESTESPSTCIESL